MHQLKALFFYFFASFILCQFHYLDKANHDLTMFVVKAAPTSKENIDSKYGPCGNKSLSDFRRLAMLNMITYLPMYGSKEFMLNMNVVTSIYFNECSSCVTYPLSDSGM